jgi:hypothetical protein
MSVGEFDSPWPVAVWVGTAAAGSDADAAGAVEDTAGDAARAVDAAWAAEPGLAVEPAWPFEDAARGQCLAHSFGEAKLLRQRSRPRV